MTPEKRPELRLLSPPAEQESVSSSSVRSFQPALTERGALTARLALTQRDDSELVALVQAGESSAFEVLYRRHSPYVMALAVRVQGNPGDVEDIVHDAFLKVHHKLHDLRAGNSFRPWLASVVVSLVRSRLRRRRMLGLLGLSTSEPIDLDALAAPDAGPEVRAQLAQVYRVLDTVSVEEKICWTLRFVEGRKLEEVAQLAGCSLATSKRRIAAVQQKIVFAELVRSIEDPSPTEGIPSKNGGAQ